MGQTPVGEPSDEEVRAQADTVLASSSFARSKRGRELLGYVVSEALAGRGDRISATTIAQDVLGRDDDFDSGTDPLVRVQMGRLRTLLNGYFEDEGAASPIVIDVPKGTYEPSFAYRSATPAADPAAQTPTASDDHGREATDRALPGAAEPPAPTAPDPITADDDGFRLRAGHLITGLLVGGLALAAVLILIASPILPGRSGYPILVVRPFENLTGVSTNDELSLGFQRQLASDLQRFRTVRVALEETRAEPAPPPNDRRRRFRAPAIPKADYALAGSILSVAGELDFVVDVIDLDDGRILDRKRVRGSGDGDYYELLAELSQSVTGRIVGGGGTLEQAQSDRLRASLGMPDADGMAAFRCLVLFDEFTRVKTPEGAEAAYDCLDTAVANHPDDGTLLAALGWVTFLIAPASGQVDIEWADDIELRDGLALAERAVAISPGNDFAHEHLGLMQWRLGQKNAALSSLQRAAALNPGSPNLLADLSLYLAFSDRWEASRQASKQAFERSGNPPGWYHLPAFYKALIDGRGRRAQETAAVVAPGDPFGPIYEFVAAVIAKDEAAIEALRPAVADAANRAGGDPLRDARPWIRSEAVLDALERRLIEGGIAVEGT